MNTRFARPAVPAMDDLEDRLRDGLVRGDGAIGTIAPILRHLLVNEDHSLFNDGIVARVRGMLAHLAAQLVDPILGTADTSPDGDGARSAARIRHIETLSVALLEAPGLLSHAHALALEWQLAEQVRERLALDPVLSPMLQALVSSPDAPTAFTAMTLLAAQARFAQYQRRMELPLGELPGDILHAVFLVARHHAEETELGAERAEAAIAALRGSYDEGRSRLGLLLRLVSGMGAGAVAALSVSHAGVALFLTALALGSRQDRDMAVLATHEGQAARLALALRAAGLKPDAIELQFLALHPDSALPFAMADLGVDRSAALLACGTASPGG